VIQLSQQTSSIKAADMTQQQKIAAALLKAESQIRLPGPPPDA